MVRSLLCFGGTLLVALIALAAGLQSTGKFDVISLFRPMPELTEAYQRGFRSDAMVRVNQARSSLEVEQVRGDESLQASLNHMVENHSEPSRIELEDVFNTLQDQYPGAQYLAANLVTSSDRDTLLNELADWISAMNPDFDSINTAVFQDGRELGVLGVMSRRIPEFSLDEANRKGGRFFNRCPHCNQVHALEIEKESRTLILSCPYCDLPFDVLASDTSGRIRKATDFFEGFELEEHPAALQQFTEKERIVALWRRVAERCDYQLDQEHSSTREVWKSPAETWREQAGDCEDTSILLADALISAGFRARVAIGWNGNIGQHAWVVVDIEDGQYVIESTLQGEIKEDSLSEVAAASDFYQPEQLFDRQHVYYTTSPPEQIGRDYFSPELWKAIPALKKDQGDTRLSLR